MSVNTWTSLNTKWKHKQSNSKTNKIQKSDELLQIKNYNLQHLQDKFQHKSTSTFKYVTWLDPPEKRISRLGARPKYFKKLNFALQIQLTHAFKRGACCKRMIYYIIWFEILRCAIFFVLGNYSLWLLLIIKINL